MQYGKSAQPDFAYGSVTGQGAGSWGAFGAPAQGAGGQSSFALSVYADRTHLRSTMQDDAKIAGLTIFHAGSLSDMVEGVDRTMGDIVLVDCPQVDGASLAALAQLDLRASRGGPRLIVSVSLDSLEDVFACMDHSRPVLLLNPNRAERVIALGQVMANMPSARVRELSDDDRIMLLRLSEQVGLIAGRIDRLDPLGASAGLAAAAQNAVEAVTLEPEQIEEEPDPITLPLECEAELPDAKLVRRIIRQRALRMRYIDSDLFADPAWDMMLDLTAAQVERQKVSVSSLCIAASVPPTTALRWIGLMVDAGHLIRVNDRSDRRRAFIALSEKSVKSMSRYFAELGLNSPLPV